MAVDKQGTILDSSVWVAFLHKEDSQHEKARKLLADTAGPVVVPEYVLIEVATILKRKGKDTAAKRFVRTALEDGGTFLPSDTLAHETAEVFCARRDALSFTDTALVVLSRQFRILTFDRTLARALA